VPRIVQIDAPLIAFFLLVHVELHKGSLDHVKQLMRCKYEAHGGEDNHLATAMDL
jgi:hypothetical protein